MRFVLDIRLGESGRRSPIEASPARRTRWWIMCRFAIQAPQLSYPTRVDKPTSKAHQE